MKWLYLSLIAMATLLMSNAAMASSTQSLSLTMAGGINSIGGQDYLMSQHGGADFASVQGQTLTPASTRLDYSVSADVDGSYVTGHARIELAGTSASGQVVKLDGSVSITQMVPLEEFPAGTSIPGDFVGLLTGSVSVGGAITHIELPVALESPFINPFGAPVVISSTEGENSILLVTGYQVGTIVYSNVQVFAVSVTGTVGSTPVTAGSATLTTWAVENLQAGTESEAGTIEFAGMVPSLLDSDGYYFGRSIIPSASNCLSTYGFSPCTFDCTDFLLGIMGVPTSSLPLSLQTGLCTVTGFISSGSFFTHGQDVRITGKYYTVWDIPAVSFGITIPPPVGGSTITGSVSE